MTTAVFIHGERTNPPFKGGARAKRGRGLCFRVQRCRGRYREYNLRPSTGLISRWWVCERKGRKGLDETVAALYRCDKKNVGITGGEFCKNAFNGVEVPNNQIDEVKGELCGGILGRFTLIEE